MTNVETEALGTAGWFSREGFPAAAEAAGVAAARVTAGLFTPAGVSRGHQRDEAIRSDALHWVDRQDASLAPLFTAFEALRVELNEGAWLGLARFELQLAHYPAGGARYVRHRDAFEGEDNRRLTAIVYLNPAWVPEHGGQLLLHVEPPVQIEPRLGRLVIFLSEKVEHEVLPAWAPRLAATAWYYGR